NRKYVLRFEYQANGQFSAADVRVKSTTLKILGKMTATNGEWVTNSFPFENGSTDKLQLEFHHYGPVGVENGLYIRKVELIDVDASAAAVGVNVFNLDLSRLAAFNFTYQDGQPGDPDWRAKVPSGIFLHCWKKESVSVFRGEMIDGRPAIGLTNLNADISS